MKHEDDIKTFILKERFPSIKKYNDVMRSSISMYKKKAINKNIIDYISSQIRYYEIQKNKTTDFYGICITWIKNCKQNKITDFSYIPELIIASLVKEKIYSVKENCDISCINQKIIKKDKKYKEEIEAIISIIFDEKFSELAFLKHKEILTGEYEL